MDGSRWVHEGNGWQWKEYMDKKLSESNESIGKKWKKKGLLWNQNPFNWK